MYFVLFFLLISNFFSDEKPIDVKSIHGNQCVDNTLNMNKKDHELQKYIVYIYSFFQKRCIDL